VSFEKGRKAWDAVSADAKDLVTKLLDMNTRTRLSAEQALAHPWIANSAARPTVALQHSLAKLSKFDASIHLKHAVQTFIACQLSTHKDTKELKDQFRSIDKNGDGKLSKQELYDTYTEIMDV
jgi:calcium-dependent protein kinase